MARPKPNPEEVLPLINAKALKLIHELGFEQMTMRRLATECDMSVGKLYHFYPSKDALFLSLEIDYFEGIYQVTADRQRQLREVGKTERQVFRGMLDAYYEFAISHIEMYRLVTSPPKVYSDYLGTDSEALAERELSAALRAIALFREQFFEIGKAGSFSFNLSKDLFLLFINSLHGLILLSQSRVWPYLDESYASDSTAFMADACSQLDLIVDRLL